MKETPEQLELRKKKRNLLIICNKLLSGVSFKTIKTWTDVYKFLGRDTIDPKPVVYREVEQFLNKLQAEKEKEWLTPKVVVEPPKAPEVKAPEIKPVEQPKVVTQLPTQEVLDEKVKNYGFVKSPNENFHPYWYQKKAIVELTNGIVKDRLRGQLALAGTGTGKTFIAAGVVRRLVDMKFADDKTFGVVKYLYITKSTIVEQTKRVFRTFFNLSIKDGVEIINIEALRSKAGAEYVEPIITVVGGEERVDWKWRRMVQPVVVLLDESQGAKNVTSTQSQIIQAYAEMPIPHTYSIFLSATPFLRVCEAKAFVLNCHFEDNEITM